VPTQKPSAVDGERHRDPSVDAVDVDVTATVPTISTSPSPRSRWKKEVITTKREVQNQKRQAHRVAERARKTETFNAALEEEKREHLNICPRRRTIIITGADVVEGRGRAADHRAQPHSYVCGLCPGDAQAPSGRATGTYHSCPCIVR
jgi:hypothetical protein